MRRLTDDEHRTLTVLVSRGSICLGDAAASELGIEVEKDLRSLVRKKYAFADVLDDGPVFRATQQGRNHVS
ncbi:hypothetical protein OF122_13195 [Pelagibacterium flavum]|uniref:Uncharacterized protein n=1 Tax=Pelagibacterium flavum TaxID=2984530 RepID=A0ABY6IMS1_9HYPH|nr:hypothetical protein [Pelagibacterium sp. YIM 151497]UYQ71015.1 hypothetical protein OF122_13195 [Pelagibacterium sp. YIM 151497]